MPRGRKQTPTGLADSGGLCTRSLECLQAVFMLPGAGRSVWDLYTLPEALCTSTDEKTEADSSKVYAPVLFAFR